MTRICTIKINRCDECPHFDNEYYGYHETCTLLNRKIEYTDGKRIIPDDCPLPENDNTN